MLRRSLRSERLFSLRHARKKLRMLTHRRVPGAVGRDAAEGSLRVAAPPFGQPFCPNNSCAAARRARRQADGGLGFRTGGAALGNIEAGRQHRGANTGGISVGKQFDRLLPHTFASSRNAASVHSALSVLNENGSKKMMSGGGASNLRGRRSRPITAAIRSSTSLLFQRLSHSNARGAAWRRCLNHPG